MSRPVRFRQIDVARALRAAKAAGMEVSKFEINPDGGIVITNSVGHLPTAVNTVAPEQSAYERWKVKQDAKRNQAKQRHQDAR